MHYAATESLAESWPKPAARWVSLQEVALLAFDCATRPEFRATLAELLLQRTGGDLAMFCNVDRGLAPDDILCRSSDRTTLVEPTLGWIRERLPLWAPSQHVPGVNVGAIDCESGPSPASHEPVGDVAVHMLVLAWRNRGGAPVLLTLGRLGAPFDPELVSAAASTACTIALADCSLPLPDTAAGVELTARQRQILELVSNGLTNAEVARLCGLSKFTIRNHLSKMFQRFGAINRTELTHLFWQNRTTSLSESSEESPRGDGTLQDSPL